MMDVGCWMMERRRRVGGVKPRIDVTYSALMHGGSGAVDAEVCEHREQGTTDRHWDRGVGGGQLIAMTRIRR